MEDFLLKTLPVGQLQTNCYLLIDQRKKDALIIDPGDSGDYISRILLDYKVTPTKIIATHGHFDHILAVFELQINFKIPFLMSFKDRFLVKNMQKSAGHFLGIKVDPAPTVDKTLSDEEIIKIGKYSLRVIETPGHTPGSICLYLKEKNILFTGDTLFAAGEVGRTDLSYSSSEDLQNSLKKIYKLPQGTVIYPGHGETSILT